MTPTPDQITEAEFLGSHEPNSPEWDALRANALGGSEIAAVVGLSPFESRFSLWHRKAGTIGKQDVNPGMEWGTRLEPAIIAKWLEGHPEFTPRLGGTFRSVEHPWKVANPDLLIGSDDPATRSVALMEAKTASAFTSHEWGPSGSGRDGIPPYYVCQIQWYMDVLGLRIAYLAVLIGGSDYREYEVEWDRLDSAFLHTKGREFWESISDGNAPSIDGSDATYEAIRQMHPEIDGSDVDLDLELWEMYLSAERIAKASATDWSMLKSRVLDAMGNSRRGLVANTPVVRREARGTGRPYLKAIPAPKESS